MVTTVVILLVTMGPGGPTAPVTADKAVPAGSAPAAEAATVHPSAAPTPALDGEDDEAVKPSTIAPAVLPVVTRFTDAWLLRSTSQGRLAALSPVCTEILAHQLAATDPNRVPVARRYGRPQLVAAGTFHARARQELSDHTAILLELVPDPSATGPQWRVTAVRPDA